MLQFSPTVADQIRFLLLSATDSNSQSVFRELCEFVTYGSEGSILLLQTCLDQIDFYGVAMQNMLVKPDIISAVLKYLLGRPNFSTVFCEALRSTWANDLFLGNLSKILNLSTPEKIAIGLALSDSDNLEFRARGQNFCVAQIEELCQNPASDVSSDLIQDIVLFLSRSEGLSKYLDSFTKMLSLLQQKETLPFVLSPMLADEMVHPPRHLDIFDGSSDNDFDNILSEIEKEMSMADIMRDLGYACSLDSFHCKEMLSLFVPLTETTVSKILSTIVNTRTGLEDSYNTYSTFSAIISNNPVGDSSQLSSWNISILVDSIKQLAPDINWKSVIEHLDHEGFFISDEEAFSFFMSVYSTACQEVFPLDAICGSVWKNIDGQLSFLRHAVCASSEVFSFAHSARKLPYVESVSYPSGGNHAWFCLDLLEILCLLAERGHAISVREIIEYPLRHLPEVLLIGMAHCHTAYNLLQYEVSSSIFPVVLNNPGKIEVIRHIWDVNSSLVLRGIVNIFSVNPDSITRILDICDELKILLTVLGSTPLSFSIKLATFAFRKDQASLEKWLNENLNLYKDAFCEACLQFFKGMLPDATTEAPVVSFQRSGVSVTTCQESFPLILKVLQAYSGQLHSQKLSDEVKRLSSQLSLGTRGGGTSGHLGMEQSAAVGAPDVIETEANAYFHQMFSGQLGIDTMVQTLARFKESSDNREQRIFDCMIANLFEEYKFFPKYPDKQLKIAAVLFGSLIKNQLVTHLTLGIALRCVLDALRKSVDSKMFMFGAKALEQFMDRLVEWPQYCNHILQISHLRSTHSDLVLFIERALARISSSQTELNGGNSTHIEQHQGSGLSSGESADIQQRPQAFFDDRVKLSSVTSSSQSKSVLSSSGVASLASSHGDSVNSMKATLSQPLQTPQHAASGAATVSTSPGFLRPARSATPAAVLRQSSYNIGFGAALNIETLVAAAERRDTPIEAPPSEIQDKIFFMINNISATNMEAKAKEFTDILNEQHYPWFAQYMVMKRASIEPNFHDLYLKFLDKVNSKSLNKEIVKATYENCKVLLRSDLIKSSSEERSLLKNLGSWLGKFTIGRNQALRAREIDPKFLIIEAYEKGLMIAVIPFTSKILEPCQCSLAYQPPNPWTMAILGLLAEIYNLPNLKMNLKFDIEVLFKNLGVDLKDVKPTSLLKDRVREVEGNPDFSNKDITASQAPIVAEGNSAVLPTLNPVELPHQVTSMSTTSHPGVHPSALSQYASSLHLASSAQLEDDKLGALSVSERTPSGQAQSQVTPTQSSFSANQLLTPISNILPHIVVNSKLSAVSFQMQLQRIIPMAMERSVREIITPVVQRSVTIATQTTKELVLKDYAMESDESRIRNAAHLMVSSLAGSLAHVTCKEPLRVAMSNHLRNYIQPLTVNAELLEQAVQLVTNDNLDLGCALIEQAATEKALQTIDGEIAPSITFKRKQREASGSAYYDATTYAQGPFARVPEALRPKPGRLSSNQQRVYEEFVKYPWHNQSTQNSGGVPAPGPLSSSNVSASSALPQVYGSSSGQMSSGIYAMPPAGPGFSGVTQPLDLISEEMDPVSAQILSASSTHTGTNDIGIHQVTEINSAIPSFSPATPDLHLEAPPASKELGPVIPPSASASDRLGVGISEPLLSTGDALDKYHILAQKLEAISSKESRDIDIQGLVAEVSELISKCMNRDEAAIAVSQKIFKRLFESPSNGVHVGAQLSLLAAIRDGCKHLVKELTSWVTFLDEDRKFNKDIIVGLIRLDLINLAEYDIYLAKLIDGGRNKAAMEFSVSLVHELVQEPSVNMPEFCNLIDVLAKLAMRPGSSESLQQLLEILRNSNNNMVSLPGINLSKEEKVKQMWDKKVGSVRSSTNMEDYTVAESVGADPPGFREQVSRLFAEWYHISELPATNEVASTHYISQLQQNGLLKGDDLMDRFFRVLTELAVMHCLAYEPSGQLSIQSPQQAQPLSFIAIDIYANLVVLVLKYSSVDQGPNKVALFPKILAVTVRAIQKEAEEKKSSFNPRPYFRLFINLLLDLTSPDPVLDGAQFLILTNFANAFHALQPLKIPGWSFAWLELVSHRNFMPKLLMSNNQKGWPFFQRLLVDLFKFMEPYLRTADLAEPVQFLYKGTLRVLLVLLHDFPEFLCDYHFSFCDVIPPSCIQMRNVILSAFPVNMRLPDPCTPNLKIDLLPEISQSPRILSEIDCALKAKQIKGDVDEYLKTRPQGSSFLTDLKQKLLLSPNEVLMAGTRYNVPLINSLALYVGMQAIQQQQSKTTPQHMTSSQVPHNPTTDILVSAAMDIFNTLVEDLDTDGRYQFLNAVANQLRYPNNHTHYFSCILLYLFAEANQDIIREQITRVLLERLIVNRPHPWGLLITFIELIKNPRYNFWKQSFIHLAPDIEKLFESVSRSCGASRGSDDVMISGGHSDGAH